MSDAEIRDFIGVQGAGCVGVFCLKNLRVDSAGQPADQYCGAVPGGVGEDAQVGLPGQDVASAVGGAVVHNEYVGAVLAYFAENVVEVPCFVVDRDGDRDVRGL